MKMVLRDGCILLWMLISGGCDAFRSRQDAFNSFDSGQRYLGRWFHRSTWRRWEFVCGLFRLVWPRPQGVASSNAEDQSPQWFDCRTESSAGAAVNSSCRQGTASIRHFANHSIELDDQFPKMTCRLKKPIGQIGRASCRERVLRLV